MMEYCTCSSSIWGLSWSRLFGKFGGLVNPVPWISSRRQRCPQGCGDSNPEMSISPYASSGVLPPSAECGRYYETYLYGKVDSRFLPVFEGVDAHALILQRSPKPFGCRPCLPRTHSIHILQPPQIRRNSWVSGRFVTVFYARRDSFGVKRAGGWRRFDIGLIRAEKHAIHIVYTVYLSLKGG